MSDSKKTRQGEVSVSATINDTGLRLAAKMPADLPLSAGRGIAKAIRFALAGAAPDFFNRAEREVR
jgi:hypothetical protein